MPSNTSDYLSKTLVWQATQDAEYPFMTEDSEHQLKVRINDFPAEPMYTLLVDAQAIIDFDDWPTSWTKP